MNAVRLLLALVIGPVIAGGCAPDASGGEASPTLESIRAATEKYQDVNVALDDGYVRDWLDTCETPYHMGLLGRSGVMGIHFLRLDRLGIGADETRLDVSGTHTDFLAPAILVYEPQADGSLELVALANMVSAGAWEAGGNTGPPTFQGAPYDFLPADPGMMMEAQYERHLWLYRDNPDGLVARYNPDVTCEHHEFNMPMIHPPGSSM